MSYELNCRALDLINELERHANDWRVERMEVAPGWFLFDCGAKSRGSLAAGKMLARLCLADLAQVDLLPAEAHTSPFPLVQVTTDHPMEACLLSQYAGMQLAHGKFFAMCSGPMRAAAAREELFAQLGYQESADAVLGILEGNKLPGSEVFEHIARKFEKRPQRIVLCVARTASLAGTFQVTARSVETALHKLHELGFDVRRIRSAHGTAPLAPVAANDLEGIGRTNDAILYGGRVTLWVEGDDATIAEIGPQVPSGSSPAFGKLFREVFEEAGRDFYKIDPHLFSPAEMVFQNLDTGAVQRFGTTRPDLVERSFGLAT